MQLSHYAKLTAAHFLGRQHLMIQITGTRKNILTGSWTNIVNKMFCLSCKEWKIEYFLVTALTMLFLGCTNSS